MFSNVVSLILYIGMVAWVYRIIVNAEMPEWYKQMDFHPLAIALAWLPIAIGLLAIMFFEALIMLTAGWIAMGKKK